jgi:RimJ/RimL family protein N-acetyltransferase
MDININEHLDIEFDSTFIEELFPVRTMNMPLLPSTSNPFSHPNSKKADVLWQVKTNSGLAGFAGICDIDMKNGHCQVIFAFASNLNVIKNVVVKLTDHVFGNLGLRKVHCLVPEGSIALSELINMSFVLEATLRKHCIINGKYTDIKWLGLLRSESGRYSD